MASIARTESTLKRVAREESRKGKLHRKPGQTAEQARNAFVYGILRHRFNVGKRGKHLHHLGGKE